MAGADPAGRPYGGPEDGGLTQAIGLQPVGISELPRASTLLQSPLWASFKAEFGWRPHAFVLDTNEPLLLLHRSFGLGRSIAYVPHGLAGWGGLPAGEKHERLNALSRELSAHLPHGTLFIRYDLPWELSVGPGSGSGFPLEPPFRKAPYDIQPPSTVVLELDASEEEILAGMKRKTRYNIRLAGKKGVRTEVYRAGAALEEVFSHWYALYEETAERDGIAIHSREYYRRLFELAAEREREQGAGEPDNDELAASGAGGHRHTRTGGHTETGEASDPSPRLYLITAEHEDDLLAGIVVSVYGDTATYMYGAGSNRKRNLMGSYAVQWEAIRLAKELGARSYDLFGIPPADDPSHPMHGLYRFKTGFGGRIVHRPGCIDYPVSSLGYDAYRGLERLRYHYHKKLKKRR